MDLKTGDQNDQASFGDLGLVWWACLWPTDVALGVMAALMYFFPIVNRLVSPFLQGLFVIIPGFIALSLVLRIPNRRFGKIRIIVNNDTEKASGVQSIDLNLRQKFAVWRFVFWRLFIMNFLLLFTIPPGCVYLLWKYGQAYTSEPSSGDAHAWYSLFAGAVIGTSLAYLIVHLLGWYIAFKIINKNISGACFKLVSPQN